MDELMQYKAIGDLKRLEAMTAKLNVEPSKEWLQSTPDGKAQYIPIAILENQLRQDFAGLVQFEILSERRELNEYIVTARIKAYHPAIGQWMNYDGIGAVQIMQDKDAKIGEFAETKKKNALQMNAPKAYAEAIKNAAKKIGVKYGANINRKLEEAYEPIYTLTEVLDEVLPLLAKANSTDDLIVLWESYPDLHTSNRFKFEFAKRKSQLTKGLTK